MPDGWIPPSQGGAGGSGATAWSPPAQKSNNPNGSPVGGGWAGAQRNTSGPGWGLLPTPDSSPAQDPWRFDPANTPQGRAIILAGSLESQQQQADLANFQSVFAAANAPQIAAINSQIEALNKNQALAAKQNDLGIKKLQDEINANLATIALSRKSGLVDQAAVARQVKLENAMFALRQQKSQNEQVYAQKKLEFAARQRDLGFQGNSLSLQQLIADAQQGRRGAMSDATARGAFSTEGHAQAQTDINTGERIGRGKLGVERKGIQLSYEQETAAGKAQLRQIYLDRQDAKLSHGEQIALLNDRRKQLQIEAQKYGVTEDAYRKQLANGIAALNLDHQVTVNNLMSQIASQNAAKAAAAQQVTQAAIQAAQTAAQSRAVGAAPPAQFNQQQIDFINWMNQQQMIKAWVDATNAAQAAAKKTPAQQAIVNGQKKIGASKMSKMN